MKENHVTILKHSFSREQYPNLQQEFSLKDQISVTQPQGAVLPQQETRLGQPQVTPEVRQAVLVYVQSQVLGVEPLRLVVDQLLAGDFSLASFHLKVARRSDVAGHESFGLISRLVQGAMCPHHAGVFLEVNTAIQAANAESSDHGRLSQGVAAYA